MAIKKASEVSNGGGFFSPKDYTSALALLIEPKSVRENVPNTYKGKTTERTEVTCTITVFNNSEELDGGAEPAVLEDTVVHSTALANKVKGLIGDAMVAVVRKVPPKNGSGSEYWDFRDASADDEAKVVAFYEKREAALAAALEDVPDF